MISAADAPLYRSQYSFNVAYWPMDMGGAEENVFHSDKAYANSKFQQLSKARDVLVENFDQSKFGRQPADSSIAEWSSDAFDLFDSNPSP